MAQVKDWRAWAPTIAAMRAHDSVQFFDRQFQQQLAAGDTALNPFEAAALPLLQGRVLDYGCGLGSLALAAARRRCTVLALDASAAAIAHLAAVAKHETLPLQAVQADLRQYTLSEDFDAVVCIGLLMFFDCPTAWRQLSQLQDRVRPGGVAVVNVLTLGTTYMDMFSAEGHCLFEPHALRDRFAGWDNLTLTHDTFDAPGNTRKVFATLTARKAPVPAARSTAPNGCR